MSTFWIKNFKKKIQKKNVEIYFLNFNETAPSNLKSDDGVGKLNNTLVFILESILRQTCSYNLCMET